MTGRDRISFEEAISERALLRVRFEELAFPQRVALKLMYGVPLSARNTDEKTGFTEMDLWRIFHGACDRDDHGFITKIHDTGFPEYRPKEYRKRG